MLVKVGSPLMFSYEIKGDVFTYPFLNKVTQVTVSDSGVYFALLVSDNTNLEKNAYTCEVTIKNSSKDFSNGIEGNITVESGNWFDDEDFGKGQKSGLFSPMGNKKVKNEIGLLINFILPNLLFVISLIKSAIFSSLKIFFSEYLFFILTTIEK